MEDHVPGMFVSKAAHRCGCGGHGWFLSEQDTWHECPCHYAGQRHPEDLQPELPPSEHPAANDNHSWGPPMWGFCEDQEAWS